MYFLIKRVQYSNLTGDIQRVLIVAEMEDDILLGLDILMKGEKGPADIKLSEGVVLLNGFIIPIRQLVISTGYFSINF
jgi:hypothetical protein